MALHILFEVNLSSVKWLCMLSKFVTSGHGVQMIMEVLSSEWFDKVCTQPYLTSSKPDQVTKQ